MRLTARRLAPYVLSILALASGAAAQTWTSTGSSSSLRFGSTTSLLSTGQVLIVGGVVNGVGDASVSELYDPTTGKWNPSGALARNRNDHTATLLPSGQVLVAGGLVPENPSSQDAAPTTSVELYDAATGTWSAGGSLNQARFDHTATLLPSGQVLVAGGFVFSTDSVGGSDVLTSAELYDPALGKWTRTGNMAVGRGAHTATLLASGKVLVAGGQDEFANTFSSAEIYDPATGTWTPTGTMVSAHDQHTATLLPSGQVLIAGGFGLNTQTVAVAELYDPVAGTWTRTQDLAEVRQAHTATLMPSGKVLVAGGFDNANNPLGSAEIFDPPTGRWARTGTMNGPRGLHYATLLASGQVLVVGGDGPVHFLQTAELYDAGAGTWAPGPALAIGSAANHTATPLPTGEILVAGGENVAGSLASAALFDAATGSWTPISDMVAARSEHTATLLASGRILVAGGHDPAGPPRSGAELYDSMSRTWIPTGTMKTARESHTATLLRSGKVLIAGGLGPSGPLGASELYDPETGQWTSTASLRLARTGHTATLQPSGRILVAGGNAAGSGPTASVESYDPLTGRWTPAAPMSTARTNHTATLLPSGQTLVAGGFGAGCGAELYDPKIGIWTATGSMNTCRSGHAATLLRSGKVLVAGGAAGSATAELYDPATGRWTPTPLMADARDFASASLLPAGQVMITGGAGGRVEVFEPELGGAPAWQPQITFVTPVQIGQQIGVEGSFFLGTSESSGSNGNQQSATNYPLLQLRSVDSGQTAIVPADPLAGWTDSTFTSQPLSGFPTGPAMLTIVTNGVPSVAQPVTVAAATLACPPPGCDDRRAGVRLGPIHVAPRHAALEQEIEATTTVTAGSAEVFDLIVLFYDGAPEENGTIVAAQRIAHLPAHGNAVVDVSLAAESCGKHRLVAVAGPGLPIADQRESMPVMVECGRGRSR